MWYSGKELLVLTCRSGVQVAININLWLEADNLSTSKNIFRTSASSLRACLDMRIFLIVNVEFGFWIKNERSLDLILIEP